MQVATAAAMDKHPICFRFPRGNGLGVDLNAAGIEGFKGVPMEVPRQLTCLCGIAAPASELRWTICDLQMSSCCITAPKNQVLVFLEQTPACVKAVSRGACAWRRCTTCSTVCGCCCGCNLHDLPCLASGTLAEGPQPDERQLHPAQIGKGVLRREGADVALLGYGTMVHTCLAAAEQLAKSGIEVRSRCSCELLWMANLQLTIFSMGSHTVFASMKHLRCRPLSWTRDSASRWMRACCASWRPATR